MTARVLISQSHRVQTSWKNARLVSFRLDPLVRVLLREAAGDNGDGLSQTVLVNVWLRNALRAPEVTRLIRARREFNRAEQALRAAIGLPSRKKRRPFTAR